MISKADHTYWAKYAALSPMLCFIVFNLFYYTINAQTVNEQLQYISFHSELEETSINKLAKGEAVDPITLLSMIDSSITPAEVLAIQMEIDQLEENLIQKKVASKPLPKALKLIFQTVHDTYFDKYESISDFPEIFDSGTYNCVTGSALYALILDRLDIEYEIRSTVDHVYVIADPKGERYIIESTDPQGGYYTIDPKVTKDYLEEMRKAKLISQQEYEDALQGEGSFVGFDLDTLASLKDLAGIQYNNKAIEMVMEQDLPHAVELFKKAHFIYEMEGTTILLDLIYKELISKSYGYNSWSIEVFSWIQQQSFYTGDPLDKDFLATVLEQMLTNVMIHENNLDEGVSLYKSVINSVSNPDALVELNMIYHAVLGQYYFDHGQYKTGLAHLDTSYQTHPENLVLQNNIGLTVFNIIGEMFDPEAILEELTKYETSYPFISEQTNAKNAHLWCHIFLAGDYFRLNNADKGWEHLNAFRKLRKDQPELGYGMERVSYGYSEASAYYVRKGQYSKARDLINEGLELLPRDADLNRKLGVINDYLKN